MLERQAKRCRMCAVAVLGLGWGMLDQIKIKRKTLAQAPIVTHSGPGLPTTALELFGLLSHIMWYEVGSHCGKVSKVTPARPSPKPPSLSRILAWSGLDFEPDQNPPLPRPRFPGVAQLHATPRMRVSRRHAPVLGLSDPGLIGPSMLLL